MFVFKESVSAGDWKSCYNIAWSNQIDLLYKTQSLKQELPKAVKEKKNFPAFGRPVLSSMFPVSLLAARPGTPFMPALLSATAEAEAHSR